MGKEYFEGQFGTYFSAEGFKYDFDPYDVTFDQYFKMVRAMRKDGFITQGKTKMFSIAFTQMYPSTSYMVTAQITFEFTGQG